MLNADIPVPAVYASGAPTYGHIFHNLLAAAALRVLPNTSIHSVDFDVQKGEYPTSLEDFDAIIISGSASSAYDDHDWVRTLDRYVYRVYHEEPRVKIFGSCFGHQVMGQSLLREWGVRVEQDSNGWELGVKEITLHERFRKAFGKSHAGCGRVSRAPEKMRLQFVHHDHVVIPTLDALPPSWMVVGTTQHCAVQGLYEPGRILTLQGHFEFDRFVNSECIKFFSTSWEPGLRDNALIAIDADDDATVAAEMVLNFFLEQSVDGAVSHTVIGGLLTPPLQE